MGLHPPCALPSTLAVLDAVGIAVVRRDEGWFIELLQQALGPYDTPELALEASGRLLIAREKKQAAEKVENVHIQGDAQFIQRH